MNHNAGIQFFGIDNVVQAYVNNQCAPFALWAGKIQLLKYDGTGPDGYSKPTMQQGMQLLNDYLSAMYQGTTAIYTLRTYEDLKPSEKIKPSTEYDTAFNFKINVASQSGEMGMVPYGARGNNAVLEELKKMNQRLETLEAEESDTEDEPQSLIGTVNSLLQEPQRLREVVDSIAVLGDMAKSFLGMPMQPRVMGNINRVSDISSDTESQEQKLNRLQKALDELEQADPSIVDHLEKLAKIAKDNPVKFRSLIGMLEIF